MPNPIVSVNITGLDDLMRTLGEELPAKARAQMKDALKEGAIIIENAMRDEAPEGEYHWLKGTMTSQAETHVVGGKDSAAVRIGPDRTLLDPTPRKESEPKPASVIAQFVELGTVRDPANAFMTRAFESVKEEAENAVVEKLKEILE